MSPSDSLSTSLEKNKARLHQLLPLQKSFDFVTRDLSLGDIPCFFVGLNGLCDQELILKIFSEFSLPEDSTVCGLFSGGLCRFPFDGRYSEEGSTFSGIFKRDFFPKPFERTAFLCYTNFCSTGDRWAEMV